MFPEMFTKDSISVSSVGDLSFYKMHDDPDLTNVQWNKFYVSVCLNISLELNYSDTLLIVLELLQ